MNQVHLTPEQVRALGKLPEFEGTMSITMRYGFNEHVKVTIAQGSAVISEYQIYPDGGMVTV